MTTGSPERLSLREHLDDTERCLAAVAGKLTAHGIQARLSLDGPIPALLAADARSGRVSADITMDSDSWILAAWAPGPGSDAAAIAGTILAVLNAIHPGMSPPQESPERRPRQPVHPRGLAETRPALRAASAQVTAAPALGTTRSRHGE